MPGQRRRDRQLGVGEQRERQRVQQERGDRQMPPGAQPARQPVPLDRERHGQHRRAEHQPAERHLERREPLGADLDEQEAEAPDQGEDREADPPVEAAAAPRRRRGGGSTRSRPGVVRCSCQPRCGTGDLVAQARFRTGSRSIAYMLNLERLRTLDALARHGSVSGAAEGLHVTTSAVSQQMAKLEREVGQQLLAKNGRGVRLTDAGRLLAEHAGRILSQVELAQSDLEAQRGQAVGELRLGVPHRRPRPVPAALAALRVEHPGLRVRSRELEPEERPRRVVRGDLDLAVVLDWYNKPLPVSEGLVSPIPGRCRTGSRAGAGRSLSPWPQRRGRGTRRRSVHQRVQPDGAAHHRRRRSCGPAAGADGPGALAMTW